MPPTQKQPNSLSGSMKKSKTTESTTQIPVENIPKRIQRVIKDSIGSMCDHKESCEEVKVSFVEMKNYEFPRRTKPVSTRISMLSGDHQNPSIVNNASRRLIDYPVEPKQEVLKAKTTTHSVEGSFIEKGIMNLESSKAIQKLHSRHNSPRTRNDAPTVLSTRMNTYETHRNCESRFRTHKAFEVSPSTHSRMYTELDVYSKSGECFKSERKYTRNGRNLSRSPSIGPVKGEISPKPEPKVIAVPAHLSQNVHLRSIQKKARKQSMPFNHPSTCQKIRGNLSGFKSPVSRNGNYMSPTKTGRKFSAGDYFFQDSGYDLQRSPTSNVNECDDIIEFDRSVNKIQGYRDKILLLSAQNKEMASCIAQLKEELMKVTSKTKDDENSSNFYTNKKLQSSNKKKKAKRSSGTSQTLMSQYCAPKSYLTQSKSIELVQGALAPNSIRKMRKYRVTNPLDSVDTNAETVKTSTAHYKNLTASYVRSYGLGHN